MIRVAIPVALLVFSLAAPAAAQRHDPAARARLEASLRALEKEKLARSASERKISSGLLHAVRLRRGERAAEGVGVRSGVRWAADGTTLVDIRADVSDGLLAAIEALGGRVVRAHDR